MQHWFWDQWRRKSKNFVGLNSAWLGINLNLLIQTSRCMQIKLLAAVRRANADVNTYMYKSLPQIQDKRLHAALIIMMHGL